MENVTSNPTSQPPARVSTIRPGLLVALASSVTGGIAYSRRDLPTGEAAAGAPSTADVARWETVRIIEDAAEHARATKCRSQARNAIVAACRHTSFGLVCPEEQEAQLWAALKEARELVDEFNATARTTRVDLFVLPGRVARDDQAAALALLGEAASLVAAMEREIGKANADAIREAAGKARALSAMLDGEAREALDTTIEAARKCARDLVRRVEKKGEEAAAVLASLDIGPIVAGRMALVALCAPDAPAPDPASSVAVPQVDLVAPFSEPIPDEPAPIPPAPAPAARGFEWTMPEAPEAPAPTPETPTPDAPAPAPLSMKPVTKTGGQLAWWQ